MSLTGVCLSAVWSRSGEIGKSRVAERCDRTVWHDNGEAVALCM